jgi:hypothetical protein
MAAIAPEKIQYCRDTFIQQGAMIPRLARSMDIAVSTLRKIAHDEDWRVQRARYLMAERHRLQHDDGVDFSSASKLGRKTNELHDLCVSLYCQKDMTPVQITGLSGVPGSTIRRWKIVECWDEQKRLFQEEILKTDQPEQTNPDYRKVIARHLFVQQRLALDTISDITGLTLPELRDARDCERWMKELAEYRAPANTRSLNEEIKTAAQSLQMFLVQQCDLIAKNSVEYDHKTFDSLSRMIKSIQYMVGQFAFLNVSIIQDVMNQFTDFCIGEVSRGRMNIGEMNTIFHSAQTYCENELNAVAPEDVYYGMPEIDNEEDFSDDDFDDSPTSESEGRETSASVSAPSLQL